MNEFNWADLHFLRPHFLWLLIPGCLLLWYLLKRQTGEDGWKQSCDPQLLQAMQLQTAAQNNRWQWLCWLFVSLAIIAMAGPAVRQKSLPVMKNQAALVIALDVSKSMLADDLKPSRLQRAKFAIRDLLAQRQDGQTALIAYAGDAFVVTPLTDDTATISSLLKVVTPEIMPTTGSNTVKALTKSAELLKQSGALNGKVLLITDDVKLHRSQDAFAQLVKQNIQVSVMAVGTAEGSPIPTSRGFVKDLRGQIVIPQVNFAEMQQAAKIGNGVFSILGNNNALDKLLKPQSKPTEYEQSQQAIKQFIDEGPWLVLLLLPLAALLYRRGILLLLLLGLGLHSEQSMALSWDDLWLNKNQQAWQKLTEKQAKQALKLAQSDSLKAAAAYQDKQYQQAAQLYQQAPKTADDYYNQANALAQSGKLKEALTGYEQALKLRADDEDTLYNKKIVEQALEQQQQEQQKQQQQNQQQDGNQEQQNQEQQQQDDNQAQQSQNDEQNQQSQDHSEQQDSESQNQQQNSEQKTAEQENQQQQQQAAQDQQQEQQAEQQQQTQTQQQKQQQEQQQEQPQSEQQAQLSQQQQALDAEEQQAMEQWLRRIKDDPGGLLRRKFLYQYHRRNQNGGADDNQTTEDW